MPSEPLAAGTDPDDLHRHMHRLLSSLAALKLRVELVAARANGGGDHVAAMREILAEAEAAWHCVDRLLPGGELREAAAHAQGRPRRAPLAKE